jgi:hypothetical protein
MSDYEEINHRLAVYFFNYEGVLGDPIYMNKYSSMGWGAKVEHERVLYDPTSDENLNQAMMCAKKHLSNKKGNSFLLRQEAWWGRDMWEANAVEEAYGIDEYGHDEYSVKDKSPALATCKALLKAIDKQKDE